MEPEGKKGFNYKEQLKRVMEAMSEEERTLVNQCVQTCGNNERQRLKQMKKIIQSSEETQVKSLIQRNMGRLWIDQYIYGNLQTKSILLNVFKNVIIKPETMQSAMRVSTFEQTKRVVELLQLKSISILKCQLPKLIQLIYGLLVKEFVQGTESIVKHQFRARWLDTFVQVIRCINSIIRVIGKQRTGYEKRDVVVVNCGHKCLNNSNILTKEVLTQLYLALLYIQPNTDVPDSIVKRIHYFHASTIVKGQNSLPKLLNLLTQIKQTEHKSHLAPILMKSFQAHFTKLTPTQKENVFDTVILLFEVGRSIYNYLQNIINTIISNGGNWNLQGSFVRKFFIATIVLKYFPSAEVIKRWPTVVQDVIVQSGNMTVPYVVDCAQALLRKLYEQADGNYEKWIQRWIKQYRKALQSDDRVCIRGVIDFINPIVLKINGNPLILKKLNTDAKENSMELGVISIIKCYKQLGKIKIANGQFCHFDDPKITFSAQFIQNLLLSNDYMISLKTLQFLTINHQQSQPISPLELQLIIVFFENCLKTSMVEYRKNYLATIKKMFERVRNIYDRQFTERKRKKAVLYFQDFALFLNKLIDLCFSQIYPDVIFQLVNPAIEIINLVYMFFGTKDSEIRKGTILPASNFLRKTNFFNSCNFYNLVNCLQSSYESVRSLAYSILKAYRQLSEKDEGILKMIWNQSIRNTNKLAIKNYQYACRMLSFISEQYPHLILNLPTQYKIRQLNICELFLQILQQRYQVFKKQFVDQGAIYYQNLLHGIFTLFSYVLESFSHQLKQPSTIYAEHYSEVREFLTKFFNQIIDILNFSVEISSANVSTVVLDTLTQSQTDKRLKVDCRGHFLNANNSKNVGGYLQSTALISSMENEEQGIQNTLVVSFYLLTRQAGLVFQTIGSLVGNPQSKHYLPIEVLMNLISTYFYALINLKHMGSVDRISNGLSKMSKVIFQNENKQLSEVPQKLLNKLLDNLVSGKFTNILRRSAGVPYAFSCLLKSQALKRKHLIHKTITTLLKLSEESQSTTIQLRIHSLNILKKLFQDSDLKMDLDVFVSHAFIISIKGFTNEEWGIRNSSLMLFSVLANRTLGIKPTYNLLQFFHKCPQLLQFIEKEINQHTQSTMYPPLYPIVLLLSRLLPFDLKENSRITIKGTQGAKQVRKQQLLRLLPVLKKAGNNHNYMGRVMTAKAIFPFMQVNKIIPYTLSTLIRATKEFRKLSNNELHYELTECLQLIVSYHEILDQQKYILPSLPKQVVESMIAFMDNNGRLMQQFGCPTVRDTLIKIYIQYVDHYHTQIGLLNQSILPSVMKMCNNIIQTIYDRWLIVADLGNSLMIKSCVNLHYKCSVQYNAHPQYSLFEKVVSNIGTMMKKDRDMLKKVDNQLICCFLTKIHQIMENSNNGNNINVLKGNMIQWLRDVDIMEIGNDEVVVSLLSIMPYIPQIKVDPERLFELEKKTQNKYMKLGIFIYLKNTNVNLTYMLHKYSDPNELQQIRYCCVQAIQTHKEIKPQLYLVYARLLEDEQYQIRKGTSRHLSKLLNLNSIHNEAYVLKHIHKLMQPQHLISVLNQNSDYAIRRKNSLQDRIFSYDKPNKYRSDIDNAIHVAFNLQPSAIHQCLSSMNLQLSAKQEDQLLANYKEKVLQRNQYQYETIVRLMLRDLPEKREKYEGIMELHPLFKKIINYMCK